MNRILLTLFALTLSTLPAVAQKKLSHAEAIANVATRVAPAYPPAAKQLRVEGSVEVDVTISEDGKVEKAEPAAGNPILARAAVEAVKQWKFKSFGGPVQVTLTFAFKL